MAESKDNRNIIRFRRNYQLNIVLVVAAIMFVYIGFQVYASLTKDTIAVYEVTAGTLRANHHFRALALRQEMIFYAEREGDIYYYESNGSKVSVKSLVYSLDETGEVNNLLKSRPSSVNELSGDEISRIESSIGSFVYDYDGLDFSRVHSFKNNLAGALTAAYNARAISEYSDAIYAATQANTFRLYYASEPGLVSYHVDGLENVTSDNFTVDHFDSAAWPDTDLKARSSVKIGDPAYKLITSTDWQLLMEIDRKLSEELADTTYIKVRFDEDGNTAWGAVELLTRHNRNYLLLSFDDSMERYADLRYIPVELLLDEQNGLKIPNSAITYKTFYSVPKSLFMSGDNSTDQGLLVRRNGTDSFIVPTIYYETEDACYVDNEKLMDDDLIVWPNSRETYRLNSTTEQLQGVYNMNKGFAVFKQIDILYSNQEYSIVANGTSYGIQLYDRIALEGSKVNEYQVIR